MLANSTAAAKKTDQPGIWEMQKSYLLNPENSKTFLILSQPKMCQKYTFLLTRAHFLGATGAPTEPVHESFLKTPPSPWPTEYGCSLYSELPLKSSWTFGEDHVRMCINT